jgi:hypothetical protein
MKDNWFHPEWEACWTCKPRTILEPVRIDELDTKWKPLWGTQ